MSKCERCERLNHLLQKERKEIVSLKGKLEAAREINKSRKKQVDDVMLAQADGVKMAEAAVNRLLFHLGDLATNKDAQYLWDRCANHRQSLRTLAMKALDAWDGRDDGVHKAIAKRGSEAMRGERSMPRRGRYTS